MRGRAGRGFHVVVRVLIGLFLCLSSRLAGSHRPGAHRPGSVAADGVLLADPVQRRQSGAVIARRPPNDERIPASRTSSQLEAARRCLYGTTLRGHQVRLEMPPQAAQAKACPKNAVAPMHQSREAHHSAWPLHCPEGPRTRGSLGTRHRRVTLKATRRGQGIATEQARPNAQGADLQVCAPGRLEPAPYGLEVRHDPSAWCHLGASPQVGRVRRLPGNDPAGPVTTAGLPDGLPVSSGTDLRSAGNRLADAGTTERSGTGNPAGRHAKHFSADLWRQRRHRSAQNHSRPAGSAGTAL